MFIMPSRDREAGGKNRESATGFTANREAAPKFEATPLLRVTTDVASIEAWFDQALTQVV